MSDARISRDNDDIGKILSDSSLRNIATGVIADEGVNAEMLFALGKIIVEKMEEKVFFKYSLKRKEKVKTLAKKVSVKLSGKDDATIDSYLLFSYLLLSTLVVLANVSNISCDNCKRHEL